MATLKAARKRRQMVAIVAIAIIIVGVGGGSILSMGGRSASTPVFTQSRAIVDEVITVDPESFRHFEFNVPAEIRESAVRGSFTSLGSGLDNDIVVSVAPEIALQNINEGKGYPAFYFSGKVTSGELGAPIEETGTMYVIVDNRFSKSSKTVDLNIELAY